MKNLVNSNPVFVVGSGRSGTTVTARILHEKLGVSMGSRFHYDAQGQCYYEDRDFREVNMHFLDNRLSYGEWLDITQRFIFERNDTVWGFKDPRASYIMGFYLIFFDDPLFIRCVRDYDKVIESLIRNYNYPLEKATGIAQ